MEKLSKEMEEKLARPETRAFLKDGKGRKGKAGGNKRKKLRLDPVVGWGRRRGLPGRYGDTGLVGQE